ncbi:CRISPR-associated protein Csx19 [Persephonella sp. KM09-Lau-8]|uniref:type III-D CRISPR-associated protein Csx19 n=1 Tax=Persephonella sp. KM09-Lau-8 TaxID=1158345 RepID=UPI00068F02CA|nr:CRISPR-associated protein Csx19 [Persephonella sp. KM09-Lau-8]
MKEYIIQKNIDSETYIGQIEKISPEFITELINNGTVVLWLDYQILFGYIEQRNLFFFEKPDYDFTFRIRAFNEDEELHIWRKKNKYFYRYRKDIPSDNGKIEYIDTNQLILGTETISIDENWKKIKEDRGSIFILPKKILNEDVSLNKRLFIKTRNYITYNPLGQVGFEDNRFVKFFLKEV